MSWPGIASNQQVSNNNLIDAINSGSQLLISGQHVPTGSQIITKSRATTWLSIDTTNSTLVNKAPNQTVAKQDLTMITASACGSVPSTYLANLDVGTNPYSYSGHSYKANKLPVNLGTTSGTSSISVHFDSYDQTSYSFIVEYGGNQTLYGTSGSYIQATGSYTFNYPYSYNASSGSIVYMYIYTVL